MKEGGRIRGSDGRRDKEGERAGEKIRGLGGRSRRSAEAERNGGMM